MSAKKALVLSATTYARVAGYAAAFNKSVDEVANNAINRWMDHTGDLVIEELARRRGRRLTA